MSIITEHVQVTLFSGTHPNVWLQGTHPTPHSQVLTPLFGYRATLLVLVLTWSS